MIVLDRIIAWANRKCGGMACARFASRSTTQTVRGIPTLVNLSPGLIIVFCIIQTESMPADPRVISQVECLPGPSSALIGVTGKDQQTHGPRYHSG